MENRGVVAAADVQRSSAIGNSGESSAGSNGQRYRRYVVEGAYRRRGLWWLWWWLWWWLKNSSSRIALCRCAHPEGRTINVRLAGKIPAAAAAISLPGVSTMRGRGKESTARDVGKCTSGSGYRGCKCTNIVPDCSACLLALTSSFVWLALWPSLRFHVHISSLLVLYA